MLLPQRDALLPAELAYQSDPRDRRALDQESGAPPAQGALSAPGRRRAGPGAVEHDLA